MGMDEVILTAWYALLETAVGKLREQFPYTGVTGGGELSPMGGNAVLEWEFVAADTEDDS